jgi:DNA-binding SARP family transcriptional activator
MAQLTIRLLGSPEITYGERPSSFRTRKGLALLVYLLLEGGLHSREALMALLWPESGARVGAVTLRGTLSRLRQGLRRVGQFLISEGAKLALILTSRLTWTWPDWKGPLRPKHPLTSWRRSLTSTGASFWPAFP